MDLQYNIIDLQYPLHRVVVNPYTYTATVYCGILFPKNNNIKVCAFNFGDTSGVYYENPIDSDEYASMVSAVSGYTSFFPNWSDNKVGNASILVPTFKRTYEYRAPGTYRIQCALIDVNNNVYRGTSSLLTIPDNYFSRRSNDDTYEAFIDGFESAVYTGTPPLAITSSYTAPISTNLPLSITYDIENVLRRVDAKYVFWELSNNTSQLYDLQTTTVSQITARFALLPRDHQVIARAAVVYEDSDNDLRVFNLSHTQNIENTGNINVSRERTSTQTLEALIGEGERIAGTDISTRDSNLNADTMYDICAIPAVSDTLPVITRFIFKKLPGLRLILCDFDDGYYDVVPVGDDSFYEELMSGVETRTIRHRYTSVNSTDFFPVFIYLFERSDGTYYSERRTLRSKLRYSAGVFEQNGNHRLLPITSSTNFRKYRNISTVVEYNTNDNTAVVRARLSIGTNPKHILSFDKIIWNVNGEGIVQVRNNSLQFGYISVTTKVPYSKFTISATVYRNSLSGSAAQETYGFYAGDIFDILTKEDSDKRNLKLKLLNQQQVLDYSLHEPEAEDVIPLDLPERLTREIEEAEYLQNLSADVQYEGTMLIFDKAITAEAPAANFLNRNYPTIASENTKQYADSNQVGFFTPSKTTLTIIDPGQFTFYANVPAIETGKPYYFPDPFKYGSSTISLKFDVDKTSFTKGMDFSYLKNLPNATDVSTVFNGYVSKHTRSFPYTLELANTYIADRKEDVFGNTYTLFKAGNSYRQNVATVSKDEIQQYIYVNGYTFYDILFNNGSSYNYELTGVAGNVIQSGITTQTESLTADNSRYAVLDFGKLSDYTTFPNEEPFNVKTQYLRPLSSEEISCGVFVDEETGIVNDFMSSDLSAFPGNGSYYYTELYEAGVCKSIPYQRPLLDNTDAITQATTATFTESLFLSNTGNVVDIDCGVFYTRYNIVYDNIIHKNDSYILDIQSTLNTTQVVSAQPDTLSTIRRKQTPGSLYIHDSYGVVRNIQDLQFIAARYGPSVFHELSGVISFEILYNKIFIQTSNYFIIDKINYNSGEFLLPYAATNIINYNSDFFNRVSNRIKVDNYVFFVITEKLVLGETNNLYIVPKLYRYNINTEELLYIYPYSSALETNEQFAINDSNAMFTELATPRICYNTQTNKINLTYILKDQNKSPTFVSCAFTLLESTRFSGYMFFKLTNSYTIAFDDLASPEYTRILFTSHEPTITNTYLAI